MLLVIVNKTPKYNHFPSNGLSYKTYTWNEQNVCRMRSRPAGHTKIFAVHSSRAGNKDPILSAVQLGKTLSSTLKANWKSGEPSADCRHA